MSEVERRLIGIVGEGSFFKDPDFISASVEPGKCKQSLSPKFLVQPENSDQVQEIVRLCKESNVPLIPVSSRGPHRCGGVRPQVPGAVVVDLSGMNKVLRINRRHRLALIEPGVTWEQLNAELAKNGLRIPQPLLPKKGKSVIATLLDREPLLSPKYQWNMTEPLRSMEIIFGTGDRIYSGMGGYRGDKDEAWENGTIPVTNAGPHQFDFMKMVTASQGTFGIVTWASVRVEVAAVEEKPLFVQGGSVDELSSFLYKNLKFRFGDEVFLLNRPALASILSENPEDAKIKAGKIGPWTAFLNVKWGALRAKEKIEVQSADIADIAQENGLIPHPSVAGMPAAEVASRLLAVTDEDDWKRRTPGDAGEIFFLSTLDQVPSQLQKAAEICDLSGYGFADCPVYIQPLHQGVAVHCHIILPGVSESLYGELCDQLFRAGAFYSRPYGVMADLMYDGNAQNTILTQKMKDIFDPRRIMNPGKLCF